MSAELAGGVALMPVFLQAKDANDKLNIGIIGSGGKGASDTDHCAGENIVALCDVDENAAAGPRAKYPKAKFYADFRKMLETEKTLDAVVISTPDHTHAPAAMLAMKLGRHVYCQKPMSHAVRETRLMRDTARERKVVTQMGNQGSAEDGLRRAVEVVQSGLIGPVRQVHVWTNRPIWPQEIDRPVGEDPAPGTLDWDLWLGPAPLRPYKRSTYHPFKWRGWHDFGGGALGDMGCNLANLAFRALKLGSPTEIEPEVSGTSPETYPKTSRLRYTFPEREGLPAVALTWYDGGWKPNPDLTSDVGDLLGLVPGNGCLLIGDKGKVFTAEEFNAQFYLKVGDEKSYRPGKDHEGLTKIARTQPRNTIRGDTDYRHHAEWIAAIKGGPAPYSNFDIAAPLSEFALLGGVAIRVGQKIIWEGTKMRVTNAPQAARYVQGEYRKGWEL